MVRPEGGIGMKLQGKVAIVTGAGRGIGRAYAHALAREGAAVIVAEINRENGESVTEEIKDGHGKSLFVHVDVSNEQSTLGMAKAAADAFGGIDILVNNAALFGDMERFDLLTGSMDYWRRFMSVNLEGVLLCTRAVVPYMRKRGGGKIINQSSRASYEGAGMYGAAKLAVNSLTVSFAKQLGPSNINVNGIAPGSVLTEANLKVAGENTVEARRQLTALKRLAQPEDLGPLVVFLACSDSDWITGQTIVIDGGQLMLP